MTRFTKRNFLFAVLAIAGLFLFGPQTANGQSGIYVLSDTDKAVFSGTVGVAANTLYINSIDAQALDVNGNAGTMTFVEANVVGGCSNPERIDGILNLGTAPVADPLASLPVPTIGFDLGEVNVGWAVTVGPGYYSGGFTLSGGADVHLEPGVYILDGAGLVVSGNARITGKDVTLYFKGSAQLTLSGDATLNLTPPQNLGVYKDVLFYFDRANTNPVSMSGGAGIQMYGKLYFPASHVTISGEAGVTNTTFGFLLVCDGLTMSGGGAIEFFRLPNGEGAFD